MLIIVAIKLTNILLDVAATAPVDMECLFREHLCVCQVHCVALWHSHIKPVYCTQ